MGTIDWDGLLTGGFIKLENGVPKRMKLRDWKPQEAFKDDEGKVRPGIVMECFEEDNTVYEGDDTKTWTVTAIRALAKLRPIIEKAEAAGKTDITVSVVRAGEGRQTVYEITEV